MSKAVDSDHQWTMRVKLLHAEAGHIGEGTITFGYCCLAHIALDGFGPAIQLTDDQLAAGLCAVAEDGTRLTLFNCECKEHTLYPEFVIEGDLSVQQFDSFEVRYSNVSEWFFMQMGIDGQIGEEVKWRTLPTPLVANIVVAGHNFKLESFYIGSLGRGGEDRTLHQHFEFRFTATQKSFPPAEVKQRARQLSNFLSILLGHPCSIVSVDVSAGGNGRARMYYGISKSPPVDEQSKDDRDRVNWLKFFTQKSEIDDCWEDVVSEFLRSQYREVIWSRFAGMQNYEGFWEYRVLGYVSLLDSYVSHRFGKSGVPKFAPRRKLAQLETALAAVKPPLDLTQHAAVMGAATRVFSSSGSFASKFQALLDSIDSDVLKIINLTQADFDLIKELRDEVAHGQQPTFAGPDLTPVFRITNRIILLLTYLFFVDVGLERDVFLRCLSRPHNKLRMASDVDEVHLDRMLYPAKFFQVCSQTLLAIQQRSRRLHSWCFVRDLNGVITYSESHSSHLWNATHAGGGGQFHDLLGLPREALTYLGQAYFEDGTQTEPVHSTVIIDLARVPT